MTTKRVPRARRHRPAPSPAAVARWRVVRPHGIHENRFVDDAELGELVGIPSLLAWWEDELAELRAALDAAVEAEDAD